MMPPEWVGQRMEALFEEVDAVYRRKMLDMPSPTFICYSSNKGWGDPPKSLPLMDVGKRPELSEDHRWSDGIGATTSTGSSTHSLFGVSNAAADLLTDEYGRYVEISTVCFREECLTGPKHAGRRQHRQLGRGWRIRGLPPSAASGLRPTTSEADATATARCSRRSRYASTFAGENLSGHWHLRTAVGNHRSWISNLDPLHRHYPSWRLEYDIGRILNDIYRRNCEYRLAGVKPH